MTQNQVVDRGSLRAYRTELPNIIDDMNLSVYAYRLYGHLKRVCGDTGECWQSGETMAQICNMSTGSISKAKQELKDSELIEIEKVIDKKGSYDRIVIVDIWIKNFKRYTKGSSPHEEGSSPHEEGSSPHEEGSSPGETKNINPIKKKPIKKHTPASQVNTSNSDIFDFLPSGEESIPQEKQTLTASESPKGKVKNGPRQRELFQIAQALAHVTGMNFELNQARLFREAKNFNLSDLRKIQSDYGPGGAWYSCDWRGRDGNKPTLAHIRETWGNLVLAPRKEKKVLTVDEMGYTSA